MTLTIALLKSTGGDTSGSNLRRGMNRQGERKGWVRSKYVIVGYRISGRDGHVRGHMTIKGLNVRIN